MGTSVSRFALGNVLIWWSCLAPFFSVALGASPVACARTRRGLQVISFTLAPGGVSVAGKVIPNGLVVRGYLNLFGLQLLSDTRIAPEEGIFKVYVESVQALDLCLIKNFPGCNVISLYRGVSERDKGPLLDVDVRMNSMVKAVAALDPFKKFHVVLKGGAKMLGSDIAVELIMSKEQFKITGWTKLFLVLDLTIMLAIQFQGTDSTLMAQISASTASLDKILEQVRTCFCANAVCMCARCPRQRSGADNFPSLIFGGVCLFFDVGVFVAHRGESQL